MVAGRTQRHDVQDALDAPRDRDGEAPIVKTASGASRGSTRRSWPLYSRELLSVRDIRAHLREIYSIEVSLDLISRVTDMDDVRDWAKRPLEDIYPIVFLSCMVLKIRNSGALRAAPFYLALGVTLDGDRDVLGMWFQETEAASSARSSTS